MEADTLVVFTTDHYNLFFELCVPIFAIGVAERASGPSDYPMLPQFDVAIDGELAREIQAEVVADGLRPRAQPGVRARPHDPGAARRDRAGDGARGRADLDLGFDAADPLGRALPRAGRRGGASDRRRSELDRRVVVAGSGAFSFEVGGPRMSEDSHVGVPAPDWAIRVSELLANGEVAQVVAEATLEQITAAGNAAGEILNWIAMLGCFEPRAASFIEAQRAEGHAYAAWRLA